MLDKTKTNPELGFKVRDYLVGKNVETPMDFSGESGTGAIPQAAEKIRDIESYFFKIMKILNLNLKDDSLKDTPRRIGKMFINEIFWGLDYNNFPKITTVENKMQYDEMIIEKDIKVMSTCEHHFVTIAGKAHVAYIPDKKVLGLSKLNRIVEFFSKRPQIQERLTEQIYYALSLILDTENIAVVVDAEHFCVKSRGVEDVNSSTITSKLGGLFKEDTVVRQEFLNLVNRK
jgi:GTP cyclohydrolase I